MEPIKKEFFVIIDGNAILHRAFHALPPLTSKDGKLANAVYGFFSMFLKIVEDLKPSYIVVCFDMPKPTFRKTLYVGYQAHRPKMDDGLASQIEVLHQILEKAKVQIFEIDGYEADDLIGTLASQVQSSEFKVQSSETIIVSGDRDMLQLVNSHVKVLAPIVGMTKMILFDEEKIEEKYGLKPTQIIDYKALVGDASDNYPGVSGVGPKTAKELLQKFGSLERIYESLNQFTARQTHVSRPAHQAQSKLQNQTRSLSERRQQSKTLLEENSESSFSCLENGLVRSKEVQSFNGISPKIAEKLCVDAEQAALAKKLATIVTDAPMTLDIGKCSMEKFNKKGLVEEFEKLGFKSLIKRVQVIEKGDFTEYEGKQKVEKPKIEEDRQLELL